MNPQAEGPIEIANGMLGDEVLRLHLTTYAKARSVPAIFVTIHKDGMAQPYGNLTVNLSSQGATLDPWCVTVKIWGENEDLARACFESGIFDGTPHTWKTPFASAPVWRLAPERLAPDVAVKVALMMHWPVSPMLLIEQAARSVGGQDGRVNLDIKGLSLAVRMVGETLNMRALGFDGLSSRELVEREPAEVSAAVQALEFNLTIQDRGRIFEGLQDALTLEQRRALSLWAVWELAQGEAPGAAQADEQGASEETARVLDRLRNRARGQA